MKEYPIIFSTEMIPKILDGIKTMTRRVIKNRHQWIATDETLALYCPYGQVGDRLWVRETWASEKQYDHLKPSEIPDTAKIYYVDKVTYSAGGYSLFTEMGKIRSARFICEWM